MVAHVTQFQPYVALQIRTGFRRRAVFGLDTQRQVCDRNLLSDRDFQATVVAGLPVEELARAQLGRIACRDVDSAESVVELGFEPGPFITPRQRAFIDVDGEGVAVAQGYPLGHEHRGFGGNDVTDVDQHLFPRLADLTDGGGEAAFYLVDLVDGRLDRGRGRG